LIYSPPQYILDLAFQPKKFPSNESCSICNNNIHGCYGHWGSKSLIKQIRERIQPRVHCFGHVHDDAGISINNIQIKHFLSMQLQI
jgi:Icc-related predicted phosphoesterase